MSHLTRFLAYFARTRQRRINLKFVLLLFAVIAVAAVGIHVTHEIQLRRRASGLLERARTTEAAGDLASAAECLRRYLELNPDDGSATAWYARVVEKADVYGRERERVFLLYEQAVRLNPGDSSLEHRCAELALDLRRYDDARRHLASLRDAITKRHGDSSSTAEIAKLEDLTGQCEMGAARDEEAERWFQLALQHDDHRVSCYDRLARLLRTRLRRVEAADAAIRAMVAKNTGAAQAYMYRWRYASEFWPAVDPKDLSIALALAPQDAEVLLTAAKASEQKPDPVSARAYYEKGWRLYPDNVDFVIGLASLEARELRLDRAEEILRRAYESRRSVVLLFTLADTLILKDKIDGANQAAAQMAELLDLGFGDTLVRFLEARILYSQKKWAEAVPKLEAARAAVQDDTRLTVKLDLMLAECYEHVGASDQRLSALRAAADCADAPEFARVEYARALADSGKLDTAVETIERCADRNPALRLDALRFRVQQAIRGPKELQNWHGLETQLLDAEKSVPGSAEPLVILRCEAIAAQGRIDEARTQLAAALAKDPRRLGYRLALARLAWKFGDEGAALQIMDKAET
jgi:cellulose synthase operon protein C